MIFALFFFSHSIELINIIFDLDLKVFLLKYLYDFNSKILTLKRSLYDGGQQLHLSEGIFHTSNKNHIFGEHYCLIWNPVEGRMGWFCKAGFGTRATS